MAADGFRRLPGSTALPDDLRRGVVAIGNFDGVHRGHQAVLERALQHAAELGVPALVLTFEPHPRVIFRPDMPVARITPAPMRAKLVHYLGFDAVIEQPFDRSFASQSAEEFVTEVLARRLGISHVVTGFDFHFGTKRQGGPAYLMEAGARLGFGVSLVDAFRDEGAEIVSSSVIRELLGSAYIVVASGLLGYRYTVEAEIVHGKKLGRTLGYPTANMVLPDETPLCHGIYAVRFRRQNGDLHDGVASYGRRPTVDEAGAALLETYLFDFSGDLYGETCDVSFFGYLRGEEKFDGLDALMIQMKRDEEEAHALLSGVRPLSALDARVSFA